MDRRSIYLTRQYEGTNESFQWPNPLPSYTPPTQLILILKWNSWELRENIYNYLCFML